MKHAVLTFI